MSTTHNGVIEKINSDKDIITVDTLNGSTLNDYFSFFNKPVTNTTPAKNVLLKEVHRRIVSNIYAGNTAKARTLKGKPYDDFKASNFDYVTFNMVCSERKDSGFITASYLFIIDIDGLGEKLPLIFERLKIDKVLSPQLIFVSPSGDGLKIVVRIDFSVIDTTKKSRIMDNIWQAVNSYFGKGYADLIKPNERHNFIDGACKDLSRACFLCHDPHAYLNINEESILGQWFIDAYQPIETNSSNKKERSKKVNPATTLQDLAERHLLEHNNHTPQLLSFISAAKNIGTPQDHTFIFIKDRVHIASDSSKSNIENLEALIEDIYNRYNTDSEGITYLTPLSFGYKILYFKYAKDIKSFILSSLFWDEVRNVLHDAGFAKRKIGKSFVYIQKKGCIISEVSPEIMRDYMTNYVTGIEESFCFTYQSEQYQIPPAAIRETYLKNSNSIFNHTWLEHLQIHEEPILKDGEREMFFFFDNVIVTVSKQQIKAETWDEKNGFCIWEEQIIKHEFHFIEDFTNSHFYRFLKNVTNHDENRFLTMVTGIGYLLHHYFRESEGQAVVFYDETITDTKTPQGGSGKGLIVNAIKQVRNVTKIDGKHLDIGNRFRWEQVTPGTQVVWLDDVKPDFDFSILHSNLTDGWTIERKYLSQFLIDPKDSPKPVICSNSIIKGGGSTNRRRQFIIELSDFYSRKIIKGDEKPIEQTHGCLFFDNQAWQVQEWNMFFTVMLNCAYQYLNYGLVHSSGINVERNRLRQATSEDFVAWAIEQDFKKNVEYDTKEYFNSFVSIYYGEHHQIGQRTFTGWMKEYAAFKGGRLDVTSRNSKQYFKISG